MSQETIDAQFGCVQMHLVKVKHRKCTFPYKYPVVFAVVQDEALFRQQVALEEGVLLGHQGHLHGPGFIGNLG